MKMKKLVSMLLTLAVMASLLAVPAVSAGNAVDVTAEVTQPALTLNIEGEGFVDWLIEGVPQDRINGPVVETITVPTNTVIQMLAWTFVPGWVFSEWTGDGEPIPPVLDPTSYQVTLDGNKTATVTFIQPEYVLTLNIEGEGTVNVIYGAESNPNPVSSPGDEFYTESTILSAPVGTIIGLVVSAVDPDYVFESWTGNVEPYLVLSRCELDMSGYTGYGQDSYVHLCAQGC